MTDKGYNGWTNWETWNTNLWVMNEEPIYRDWQRWKRTHNNQFLYVAEVQEFFLQNFPQGTPDMSDDPTAIFRINWEELMNAWNED